MAQIFPIDFDEKLTMAQDDYILFSDSEDGNKIKKAQYKNLKGEKGDPGTPGADGKDGKDGTDGTAATITVGSTTTGAAGSSASVVNSGTSSAAVLDFTIPQGAKGEPGEDGQDGADGAAATITVGTTTTLPAGSSATVTNVGTSQDAILNFGIPKGDSGTGSGDVNGPASSTDGNLAVFDGVTGKIIKDGGAIPTGFTPSNTGTTGQVLKKTASGYNWDDESGAVTSVNGQTGAVTIETPNTKTFYLSSTSDLTTAQAAYDWYADGKNPIVDLAGAIYVIGNFSSSRLYFYAADFTFSEDTSDGEMYREHLAFVISGGAVTSITSGTDSIGRFLDTGTDYSTPYTPQYNGSPATKKYVDDKQSTITVTLAAANWSNNEITVTATGVTASNTVIVSPAPSDIADYSAGGVYCSSQSSGTLTFACDTEPTNDIDVNVVIIN